MFILKSKYKAERARCRLLIADREHRIGELLIELAAERKQDPSKALLEEFRRQGGIDGGKLTANYSRNPR